MNDLPPITVNQVKTDSDNTQANPSPMVPNETASAPANNQLDALSENLDEPNLADPLPAATPPQNTNNQENLGAATTPISANNNSAMGNNSSPNPQLNLEQIDPTMMGMQQSSSIGRRASIIIALLITVIFTLVGLGLMLMNQNSVLKKQNTTLEEIRKLQRSSLNTASPTPKPTIIPTPIPSTNPTATGSTTTNN